jgi:hypothetical protein
MAVLSKTGITNGATIQTGHVTQSVDAFTGLVSYDITLSGSLTLTGSLNQSGSIRVSNAVTASSFTGSFTGSYTGSFTGSLLGVASSATSSQIVLGSSFPSGSGIIPNQPFKFIAGSSRTGASPNTVAINVPDISSKTLGTNCFVTATVSGSGGNSIVVNSLTAATLVFESQNPSTNFHYIIMHI